MQFYPHRTVEEQAERLPEELREAYKKSQIDRITISNGTQRLEITGYAEYSYLEEKSYVTQPVRTQSGAIEEIEEYATFLTPRLIIKYNMMHIDDYRSLMKLLKSQNAFIVTFYDVVEDKIVSKEMYVAPPSMPIIYQQMLMALGIQEYVIELIGTNAGTEMEFSINYYGSVQTYLIIKGTTWREWVANSNEYKINDDLWVVRSDTEFEGVFHPNGLLVKADDIIFQGTTYSVGMI